MWSWQQLSHTRAQVFFRCHLFRKSAMDQRLILSALRSAALQHCEPSGQPDTYRGSFDHIPAHSQVRARLEMCVFWCPCFSTRLGLALSLPNAGF